VVGVGWLWSLQVQAPPLSQEHHPQVGQGTEDEQGLLIILAVSRDVQRRRIFKQHHRTRELLRSVYNNDLLPKVDNTTEKL
jgi:hypothetical protein